MRKYAAKQLSGLFLLPILLLLQTACGTATVEPSRPDTVSGTDLSQDTKPLFYNLPEQQYDADITFLVEGDYMDTYASVEILPQERSYDGLNQAIKNRNNLVEERFGIRIREIRTESSGDMLSKLRTNAVAGMSEYDVIMPYMGDAAKVAQEGLLYDLCTLPYIHLTEAYYDQGSVKDLSINGKNYFITGDLSLLTYDVTHVLVFNKDVIAERHLENPYELVQSGEWTIDKLHEMARGITADTDGEVGMSCNDTYGFLVNKNFISSMFIGAGQRFSVKNGSDEPELAVYSAASTSVFDKIFQLVNDQQASGLIDKQGGSFATSAAAAGKTVWEAATDAITDKRVLFRAVSLNSILTLGEQDCNFGILPTPKYMVEQDQYYCRVSTLYATCIAIPVNARDAEMSSVIADAMMQASTDTVKDAYIEVIMKDRKIRDDESEEMLDLIFASRVYDFGSVYNWGGAYEWDAGSLTGFMNEVAFSGTNTFVSSWQTIESSVQTAMEATIQAYRSLY